MKCKYCNSEIKDGDKFCRNCGAPVEKVKKGRKSTKKVEEVKEEVPVEVVVPAEPVKPVETESNGLAIASIVIGAISFFIGWFLWILPGIGLVLGICCKKKCTERTTGIILNSIALFFVTIVVIITLIFLGIAGRLVVNTHEFDEGGLFDDFTSSFTDGDESLNWNLYKSLRNGEVGYNMDINGTFRILDTNDEGWSFNNGLFYWYKDVDNASDNYWFGKTNILTGKNGLNTLGISESKIEDLVIGSNVSDENIYAIEFTPNTIISNGIDKSSTNIPENTKWTYVWVLVDHGSEGIEARVLNVDTEKVTYYVKLAD